MSRINSGPAGTSPIGTLSIRGIDLARRQFGPHANTETMRGDHDRKEGIVEDEDAPELRIVWRECEIRPVARRGPCRAASSFAASGARRAATCRESEKTRTFRPRERRELGSRLAVPAAGCGFASRAAPETADRPSSGDPARWIDRRDIAAATGAGHELPGCGAYLLCGHGNRQAPRIRPEIDDTRRSLWVIAV